MLMKLLVCTPLPWLQVTLATVSQACSYQEFSKNAGLLKTTQKVCLRADGRVYVGLPKTIQKVCTRPGHLHCYQDTYS